MRYGVIYSVDVPRDVKIGRYRPPHMSRWKLTEGDEQYAYDYFEGDWAKGKHRKWVGTLSQKQFDNFVSDQDLHAEDVETCGSLGVPWSESGVGIASAVCFSVEDDPNACVYAYVTPLLGEQDVEKLKQKYGDNEEDWWDHVREEVINHYGTASIKPYPTREHLFLGIEEEP